MRNLLVQQKLKKPVYAPKLSLSEYCPGSTVPLAALFKPGVENLKMLERV
jgi:hypothetical protein